MTRAYKKHKRILILSVSILVLFAFSIGYLAKRNIRHDDPQYLIASQKISKSLIMKGLDVFERNLGSKFYAPTPFDSPAFSYANMSDPYYEQVRKDERLTRFFKDREITVDLPEVISMMEYLRDLFPHGTASRNYLHTNVLEMIDAAEQGEKFLCGNISKMLVQLVHAGGTQARTIGLQSESSGHVVVEIWSNMFNKWVLLDPDYNVYYVNNAGVPLSAINLYEMSQNDSNAKAIRPVTGISENTLHKPDTNLVESYYKKGFTVNFYNRWVDQDLARHHPARSPVIMGYYIGNSTLESFYYKYDTNKLSDEIRSILYMNPSAYQHVH